MTRSKARDFAATLWVDGSFMPKQRGISAASYGVLVEGQDGSAHEDSGPLLVLTTSTDAEIDAAHRGIAFARRMYPQLTHLHLRSDCTLVISMAHEDGPGGHLPLHGGGRRVTGVRLTAEHVKAHGDPEASSAAARNTFVDALARAALFRRLIELRTALVVEQEAKCKAYPRTIGFQHGLTNLKNWLVQGEYNLKKAERDIERRRKLLELPVRPIERAERFVVE